MEGGMDVGPVVMRGADYQRAAPREGGFAQAAGALW